MKAKSVEEQKRCLSEALLLSRIKNMEITGEWRDPSPIEQAVLERVMTKLNIEKGGE